MKSILCFSTFSKKDRSFSKDMVQAVAANPLPLALPLAGNCKQSLCGDKDMKSAISRQNSTYSKLDNKESCKRRYSLDIDILTCTKNEKKLDAKNALAVAGIEILSFQKESTLVKSKERNFSKRGMVDVKSSGRSEEGKRITVENISVTFADNQLREECGEDKISRINEKNQESSNGKNRGLCEPDISDDGTEDESDQQSDDEETNLTDLEYQREAIKAFDASSRQFYKKCYELKTSKKNYFDEIEKVQNWMQKNDNFQTNRNVFNNCFSDQCHVDLPQQNENSKTNVNSKLPLNAFELQVKLKTLQLCQKTDYDGLTVFKQPNKVNIIGDQIINYFDDGDEFTNCLNKQNVVDHDGIELEFKGSNSEKDQVDNAKIKDGENSSEDEKESSPTLKRGRSSSDLVILRDTTKQTTSLQRSHTVGQKLEKANEKSTKGSGERKVSFESRSIKTSDNVQTFLVRSGSLRRQQRRNGVVFGMDPDNDKCIPTLRFNVPVKPRVVSPAYMYKGDPLKNFLGMP